MAISKTVASASGFGGSPPQKPALEITKEWINPAGGNLIAKLEGDESPLEAGAVRLLASAHEEAPIFGFPGVAAIIGKDGAPLKSDNGKIAYRPTIIWQDDAGKRFSEAVVALFRARHPEILGER